MKKLLAIIVTVMLLTGCMTANMLEAERSYYQATVQMQQAKAAHPLFELAPALPDQPIVLGNVGSFKVYAPVYGSDKEIKQYTQTDYVGPWLRVVSAALPWISFAREVVDAPEKCTARLKRIMNENQVEFDLTCGDMPTVHSNTTALARAAAVRAKG